MRKALILLPLIAVVLSTACATGPTYCNRYVDDYHNKFYQENPAVCWVFTDILPVFPIVKWLAYIPDWLVLNPVQFWGYDVWAGEGTPFVHENPTTTRQYWFAK